MQLRTSQRQLEQLAPGALEAGPLATLWPGLRAEVGRRAVDEAFGLREAATFPRDKATFNKRLEEGRRLLQGVLNELSEIVLSIGQEYQKFHTMLKALKTARSGSSKAALADLESQVSALLPAYAVAQFPRERLKHLARYLKALQVRLGRLPNDPAKDDAKAAPVSKLWQEFLKREPALRARTHQAEAVDELRWLIEEWRVQVFAPEVKTAVPVSEKRVLELWQAVQR